MGLSDRLRNRAESGGVLGPDDDYGNASAADIARFGVRRRRGEDDPLAAPGQNAPSPEVPGARAAMRGQERGRLRRAGAEQGARAPQAAEVHSRGGVSIEETDALAEAEWRALRRKAVISAAILAALFFLSLGVLGAQGGWGVSYTVHGPAEVVEMLVWHVQAALHSVMGSVPSPADEMGLETMLVEHPFYFALPDRAGVLAITLVCAVLLSISGMLYQNVFKNPIAGPGMLGVSSGVSLGMMLLVYQYGVNALSMITDRYLYCYGLGALVLVLVIMAGRKLSGRGRPFDIVSMLLIGSIVSQLVGFVVSYVTLFVMDPDVYQVYITVSQMLVVDTSLISWACLAVACAVSIVPVWALRFRMNALAFDEAEVKMAGVNLTGLRAVALICGAVMILAAQIHIGAVAMVSLIVPFLSRAWFGCEFRKQLVGNVCISTILLLVCRDIVDLIPFVGDGIGIGSAVSAMALPIFLLIMARHMRGWQ